MRSTRTFLVTAAAAAALAIGTPGAHAASGGDWDNGGSDSSHSVERGDNGGHESPHGGVHAGGGALSQVKGEWGGGSGEERGEEGARGEENERPHGGVHA
ncbi:hypothetical protein, partial [Streptomyces sp. SID8352]|uniref:hypothetical protein n=2 Tax=Streptomyces TaxID=1883 RepID=UPI00136BC06F